MEKYSEKLYNKILNDIVIPIVGKEETDSSELDRICKMWLKDKFKGVYPSDQTPHLTILRPYAIINVDKSNEPGTHWVAMVHCRGKTYMYDSFGRDIDTLIPSINKHYKNIDTSDAEQKITQNSCGARCIAFLLLVEQFGMKYAKHI